MRGGNYPEYKGIPWLFDNSKPQPDLPPLQSWLCLRTELAGMRITVAQKAIQKNEAAEMSERLRGLTPEQANTLRRALQLQAAGDRLMAGQWLLMVARQAPDHPEVLRWLAA